MKIIGNFQGNNRVKKQFEKVANLLAENVIG